MPSPLQFRHFGRSELGRQPLGGRLLLPFSPAGLSGQRRGRRRLGVDRARGPGSPSAALPACCRPRGAAFTGVALGAGGDLHHRGELLCCCSRRAFAAFASTFGGWALLYKSPLSDVTPSRMLRTQPYTAYYSPELTAVASDLNTGWTALHTTAVRLY
jgi:hypothetical protein